MLKKDTYGYIQSYKHDNALHRTWCKAFIIEASAKRIVVVSDQTDVVDAKPLRKWTTIEPAVCFFYPDKWYNVIAMIRKKGIHYYCNVASPYNIEGNIIQYIDYDLDIKINADGEMVILDEDEYELNSKVMNYSSDLMEAIEWGLECIKSDAIKKASPFNHREILEIYAQYCERVESAENKLQK